MKTSNNVDPSNTSRPAVMPGQGPDGVLQSTTSRMAGMPSIKEHATFVAIGKYERNTFSIPCGGIALCSVLTATFTSPPNQFFVEARGGGSPGTDVVVVVVAVVGASPPSDRTVHPDAGWTLRSLSPGCGS